MVLSSIFGGIYVRTCVIVYLRVCIRICMYVYIMSSIEHVSSSRASDTLQHTVHTATHCSTLQHTVAHCNTATHRFVASLLYTCNRTSYTCIQSCNTMALIGKYCCIFVLRHPAAHCGSLQHIAARGSILQHTTAHCNTLQRTAMHFPDSVQV